MLAVLAPTLPAISSSPSTERWIFARLPSSSTISTTTTAAAATPITSAIVK